MPCFWCPSLVWLSLAALTGPAHAVPDLTEAQRIQLETAADGQAPDEPAWTGLLTHVSEWDPGEAARGFVPGAAVPDYPKLLVDPAAHRGDLVVVEGRYAGRQRRIPTLRSGPWGRELTEWGVVVAAEDSRVSGAFGASGGAGGQEVVAVVYLVDPIAELQPPREGQPVQILCRFYKLWNDRDAEGNAQTYPVFVGRAARLLEAPGAGSERAAVVGAVVLMAGVFAGVLWLRARGAPSRRQRVLDRMREHPSPDHDDAEEPELSDDPAAALGQLQQDAD